jgi:DASH complex subunit DAD2
MDQLSRSRRLTRSGSVNIPKGLACLAGRQDFNRDVCPASRVRTQLAHPSSQRGAPSLLYFIQIFDDTAAVQSSQPATMAYNTRQSILPSSRHSTFGASANPSHSTALQQRITQKRAELENLKQLRDLSGELATHMADLEKKLSTLRDGAESVACVLQNWEGVLSVIHMASSQAGKSLVPKAQSEEPQHTELPVTLVRIPVENKAPERPSAD